MLYTLYAVQVLAVFDELGQLDGPRTAAYVAGLQQVRVICAHCLRSWIF